MNANLSQSTDTRAAMVAAIRALADFLEKRTDLPVPNSVHAQHSLLGIHPANADVVRDVAAKLGVEPDIDEDGAHAWHYIANKYPVSVRYVVHGALRERDLEGGAR